MTRLIGLAWMFILLVAAYDVYFAWHYREVFECWEQNPVARRAVRLCGVGGVLGFRVGMTIFAVGVAVCCHRRRHRLCVPYTSVVAGVHGVLLLCYFIQMLSD